MSGFKRVSLAALVTAGVPQALLACSVCFGDPDSQTAKGIEAAVLLMVGVTGTMLGSIAAFFIRLGRRSKKD